MSLGHFIAVGLAQLGGMGWNLQAGIGALNRGVGWIMAVSKATSWAEWSVQDLPPWEVAYFSETIQTWLEAA